MKVLRWIATILIVLVVAIGATALLARLGDGPTAIFPGGPLESGELYAGDEPDWTFARDIGEMDLQLVEPDSSRTIWLLVYDKKLYLVSGYMNTAFGKLWKHWPMQAEADGRAVVRVDGKRYERQLVRLFDAETVAALAAEAQRKYGVPMPADAADTGSAWFFEARPREG